MTEQNDLSPPQKKRNWFRLAFIVSLAVNLLIIGALMGAFWKHERPKGRHLDRMSMGLGAYILALPEPQQEKVMALVGKGSDDRRAFRKAMWKHRDDLHRVLRAEPFSEEAVRNAMDVQRGSALSRTKALQDAYLAAVMAMSAEERAAHFERAEQIQKDRKKHKRKKKD